MPPAEAPEKTESFTSCGGIVASPFALAAYQTSSAWTRKSTTPPVYAPAEIAPAPTKPISKDGLLTFDLLLRLFKEATQSPTRLFRCRRVARRGHPRPAPSERSG